VILFLDTTPCCSVVHFVAHSNYILISVIRVSEGDKLRSNSLVKSAFKASVDGYIYR